MQLSVYALAAREVFDWNPARLTLHFLQTNQPVSATRDDKKLNKVRAEIQEAAADIRAGEFPAKPGFCVQVLRLRIHLPGAGARRGGQRLRRRITRWWRGHSLRARRSCKDNSYCSTAGANKKGRH